MGSLRILLIDENNNFRNSALNFINTRIKYESLSWASTAEEALNKIDAIEPNLILMDSKMVGKNGPETIEIIRKLDKNAIIIFMTLGGDFKYNKELLDYTDEFISRTEFTDNLIPMIEKIFGYKVNRLYS